MKRTGLFPSRFRTWSATSTTGPQVRLSQNFGVENTSTNGARSAIESATEWRRSPTSGGVRVVSAARSPSVEAIVGVREGNAFAPTAGAFGFSATSRSSAPWIGRPPTGSATSTYLPASGSRSRATKTCVTSPAAASETPGTPTFSSRAVVRKNGLSSNERATHTRARGRSIDFPRLSMTRKTTRTSPRG